MLNRRELVRNGILLSTLGSLTPVRADTNSIPADVWVIDTQLQAAPSLVTAARSLGTKILTFEADPGAAWMNRLEPEMKKKPFALGGYTSASVLFCLQYLARDYGLSLAALGDDTQPLKPSVADTLVDLRESQFADQRTGWTWLMLPRRT